jgi:hypothetical protein
MILRAIVLIVTMLGIARAGSGYLYCSMAGTIGEAPCCKHAANADPVETIRRPEMECCQAHALPPLPLADRAAADSLAPELRIGAPPPSLPDVSLRAGAKTAVPRARSRAGPAPPRYASDVRADLMIFLC